MWFSDVPEGERVFNHHAGAVNHEQARRLNFGSLKEMTGPEGRSIHYQQSKMDALATTENTFELLALNTRTFQTEGNEWHYFDPHSPKYTGRLSVLKGWCGGRNEVRHVPARDLSDLQEAIDGYAQFKKPTQEYADEMIRLSRQVRKK